MLTLRRFLVSTAEAPMEKPEMAKLWKAIFYCAFLCLTLVPPSSGNRVVASGFWMSDKPLVQQGLASKMAELLLEIPSTPRSLDFLRGFWTALVREWNGIDRLRQVSEHSAVDVVADGLTGWTNTICLFENTSTPPSYS